MVTRIQKQPSGRLVIIDALRGFALLGIIIAHMTEQYYSGMIPEKFSGPETRTVIDSVVSGFVGIFISGKFFMIFSFLFGMSFYIQLNNGKGDASFILKFSWRLVLLFVIGMIHHLNFRGDILTIYAMLGFGLLLTYRLPANYILWIGFLFVIDVPGILTRMTELAMHDKSMNDFIKNDQADLMRYYQTFKSGAYYDLIIENLNSFKTKMDYQVWSGRIYITMGLFLLGLYAGKIKFFEELSSRTSLLNKYLTYAAWSLLTTFLVAVAFFAIGNAAFGGLSQDVNIAAFLCFADILNVCLAVIYVIGFVLLFKDEKWKNRLMYFNDAGRMGLTTYLTQTVFGLLIYSTIGLGLLSELGAALSFVIAIVLYIFQLWYSKLWLKHFNYGPVEWIWRCLTNFKFEPLLKKLYSTA